MKAEYVNIFIEATYDIFYSLLNTQIQKKSLYCKENSTTTYDITSSMYIHGDIALTILLSCQTQLLINITNEILNTDKYKIDSDVVDAGGEILNIIVGRAKKVFREKKHISFKIGLPEVVVGRNHSLKLNGKFLGVTFFAYNMFFALEFSV
jgi:CheY-specific phosphatase CheX